ncbi:unnamed protein product [Dovyalis caffra]|uniref:Uncharacterized protein n=1 Tax=Dovyalis caffra TaxID=77055 RepID=A0AAV1SG49_9ROSI|nr:unnamed protein product [Dovyalis caffra]
MKWRTPQLEPPCSDFHEHSLDPELFLDPEVPKPHARNSILLRVLLVMQRRIGLDLFHYIG